MHGSSCFTSNRCLLTTGCGNTLPNWFRAYFRSSRPHSNGTRIYIRLLYRRSILPGALVRFLSDELLGRSVIWCAWWVIWNQFHVFFFSSPLTLEFWLRYTSTLSLVLVWPKSGTLDRYLQDIKTSYPNLWYSAWPVSSRIRAQETSKVDYNFHRRSISHLIFVIFIIATRIVFKWCLLESRTHDKFIFYCLLCFCHHLVGCCVFREH